MGVFRQRLFGQSTTEQAEITKQGRYGASLRVFPGLHGINDAVSSEQISSWYQYLTNASGSYCNMVSVDTSLLRGEMGQSPIILSARFYFFQQGGNAGYIYAARPINLPTWSDWNTRYRTLSTTIGWNDDDDSAWWPFPGIDVVGGENLRTPDFNFFDQAYNDGVEDTSVATFFFDVTTELAFKMLRSRSLDLLTYGLSGSQVRLKGPSQGVSYYPFLNIAWLYPVEFYHTDALGVIDVTQRVGNDLDTGFYLGAIDRGESGSPVKYAIRNMSTTTKPIVEILDDHPEYTTPAQTEGTGSGSLDFVELADASVSQQYRVKILAGGTTFEVVGLAYGDNANNLHPTYDATASWQGTVGVDWTAPDGGMTIPAEAWQAPGLLADDIFDTFVRGNTTDTSWPADSNDQVQMDHDNAGSPEGDWRKIPGRRSRLTAEVTVDATTKKIPIQPTPAANWEVGAYAFLFDGGTLQEGNVASADIATIGADVFTGSGLDDLTLSGNYNGAEWWDTLQIEIDGTGTPDTFTWSKDGGTTPEAAGVAITGSAQLLADGVYVTFGATTGHTSGDLWDSDVNPFYVELENLTNNSDVFTVNARVGTSLPITSLEAAVWAVSTAAFGLSETPANRVYIDSPATLGFVVGNDIVVQSVISPSLAETQEIADVQPTYIDVVASTFANDYEIGSTIWKVGTGVAYFHQRAVAELTTTEELKEFRLNARL